jgi:hypothetical protein
VAADRSLAMRVGCAAMIAAAIPAWSAELKDPLSPLTPARGSILCFRRDYSPEHLMQHPKQTTRSVLLAFQERGLVTIVLSQRTGIDTSDRKMIPNFNKPAGFDCIVTVGDSAEEGGYVLIDPAQDGKSLTLFIQSPITAENDSPGKAKGYNLTLGREDRSFALTRIGPMACQSFKAVTE